MCTASDKYSLKRGSLYTAAARGEIEYLQRARLQ